MDFVRPKGTGDTTAGHCASSSGTDRFGSGIPKETDTKIDLEIARSSLDAALVEADKVARDAVLAVQQMLVDDLKASHGDGKLTKEEAQTALETAKMEFLRHISGGSLDVLEASLGPVEVWVAGLIEAKVAEQKRGIAFQVERLASPFSSPLKGGES